MQTKKREETIATGTGNPKTDVEIAFKTKQGLEDTEDAPA